MVSVHKMKKVNLYYQAIFTIFGGGGDLVNDLQ